MGVAETIAELESLGLDRPYGIEIRAENDCILVGNDELVFAITPDSIERGIAKETYAPSLARLIEVLGDPVLKASAMEPLPLKGN